MRDMARLDKSEPAAVQWSYPYRLVMEKDRYSAQAGVFRPATLAFRPAWATANSTRPAQTPR
jgi:hypothetical protein